MDKTLSKNRVAAVRTYLDGIGKPVSQVQAYEVVARAHGFESKHTLAAASSSGDSVPKAPAPSNVAGKDGQAVRIFEIDDTPFTAKEIEAMGDTVAGVIPVPVGSFLPGESVVELVGEVMFGGEIPFQIGKVEAFPHYYGPEYFALYATARVALDMEKLAPVVIDGNTYMSPHDLEQLCQRLYEVGENSMMFSLTSPRGETREKRVVYYHSDGLDQLENIYEMMQQAAQEREMKNSIAEEEDDGLTAEKDLREAMGAYVIEIIDTQTQSRQDDGIFLDVGDLATAKRLSKETWMLELGGRAGWLLDFSNR